MALFPFFLDLEPTAQTFLICTPCIIFLLIIAKILKMDFNFMGFFSAKKSLGADGDGIGVSKQGSKNEKEVFTVIEKKSNSEQYIEYSDKFMRFYIHDKREIRFRMRSVDNKYLYNVKTNAYIVVTRMDEYEEISATWYEFKIDKCFHPSMSTYWSIDHCIDDDELDSHFLKLKQEENLVDISIKVYSSAQLSDGRTIYASKRYPLDESTFIYGRFKKRFKTHESLPEDDFNAYRDNFEEEGNWDFIKLKYLTQNVKLND